MKRALVLAAALLALAGCGGGGGGGPQGSPLTKGEYQQRIKEVAAEVGERIGETLDTGGSSREDAERARDAIREFADELEKINPPAEIAQLHADFVAAMRAFAGEVVELFEKLDAVEDPGEAIGIVFGSPAFQKLAEVQRRFRERGYELELGGS